jgi:polyhydroxybutyrate depolymerase
MSVVQRSLAVNGSPRPYLIAAPPRGRRPEGIVLCLHGSTSTSSQQRLMTGMERLAGSGAVVVFPQGIRPRGRGFEWDPVVDTPYLASLIEELRTEFGPVRPRVCASGMSGGARQSCHLAWVRPDLVAAVGAVAGVRSGEAPAPACPVPVIAFHGTADRINPYRGGRGARWDRSVPDAVAAWAHANHVPEQPEVIVVTPTLTRWIFGTDGGPGEVRLWISRGAGHTWPGGRLTLLARGVLGRTSREIDATEAIWGFYLRHATEG